LPWIARDADDLARAHGQVDAVEDRPAVVVDHVDALEGEHVLAGIRLGLVDRQVDVAPDHERREVLRRGRLGVRVTGDLAAAQDGDVVGDGQGLLELVGDEDDGGASVLELGHDPEELDDLLRGQHGRRLVEHEDLRAAEQHLDDLDALLDPDRRSSTIASGSTASPYLSEISRTSVRAFLSVHDARAGHGLDAEDDVLVRPRTRARA
jgi:hypothetical protein